MAKKCLGHRLGSLGCSYGPGKALITGCQREERDYREDRRERESVDREEGE